MPTADSFTALGAGNGFTKCVSKHNGVGATPLTFSLEQAMDVYWLTNRISGTDATWTGSNIGFDLPDFSIRSGISDTAFYAARDNYAIDEDGFLIVPYLPRQRVCGNLENKILYADFGPFLWGRYSANNNEPIGSGGAFAIATMGYEGGFQIVEDEDNPNGKNKYGIVGEIKGFCRSEGYILSSFEYELLQHYTTRAPDPGEVNGSVGTISIGDFTLYSWEGHLFGGGGIGTVQPISQNLPRISSFEKYTF
jgi:hypothetical protein